MQTPEVSISRLEDVVTNVCAEMHKAASALACLRSLSADPPTSSSTAPTGSRGDGAACPTGGPTDAQMLAGLQAVLDVASADIAGEYGWTADQRHLAAFASGFASALSSSGGSESQPPRSDAPPDSARGESFDPTSLREGYVLTPIPTHYALSDALRMADALLSGTLARSAHRLSDTTLQECSLVMREVKSALARLRTLT